jgi:hypothetical protein
MPDGGLGAQAGAIVDEQGWRCPFSPTVGPGVKKIAWLSGK